MVISCSLFAQGADRAVLASPVSSKKIKETAKRPEKTVMMADTITDEFLDTLNIKKKLKINDYSMVGVQYGVGLSQVMWNPSQKQNMLFLPVNFGVTYTLYGKMFGYMPYFGFQTGLFYAQEGYQFKYNEERDYTYKIEGAEKAILDVVEVPVLFQFHIDTWNFKIMAQVGCFAGYRLGIERFPGKTGNVTETIRHSFLDTDRRLDYGIKGGAGFALVFTPVEIQFQAMYKHSLSSLYEPDYASEYYYRYAYPSNIIISVGANFHITKRSGRTKGQIKKIAKDMVYKTNTYGNTDSQSR
jgi:hypothetical protein